MARPHLVAVVLAAALGRGYAGRHRLVAAALGRPLPTLVTAPPRLAPTVAGPAPAPSSRQSLAPRLRVVRTTDPQVASLPPRQLDDMVYAAVDAERDEQVTATLASGADVRPPHRARHSA